MKSSYKALIVDVDGTLVKDFHSLPTPRVTEAIKKASKKIHIGLATSRPLFLAKNVLDHLELSGPSIVATGAHIVDSQTKKTLFEQLMDAADIPKIISIKESYQLTALINDCGEDKELKTNASYPKPIDVWLQGVQKEQVEKVVKELSKIPTITYFQSASYRVEGPIDIVITHAAATKQQGILKVAEMLNINTHEIIGIGDGYNDFPLLMACGLKVAMGNAVEDLKAIADYIASSVENDGVAHVIEKFILNDD